MLSILGGLAFLRALALKAMGVARRTWVRTHTALSSALRLPRTVVLAALGH